jgi:predicted nucleotide-binding protein
MAQATVVMFTPDEKTQLRSDLRETSADGKGVWQPRPNVLIEAGMALARDEARTILVHLGTIRTMSDLEGRHVVHLENSAQKRNELIQRLRVAGCKPVADGTDWLHEGDFTLVAH